MASVVAIRYRSPLIAILAILICLFLFRSFFNSSHNIASSDLHSPTQKQPEHKYAIATFLAGDGGDDAPDNYFVGTRILTHQILHANETRCKTPIPFIVLVTHKVSEKKRAQLTKDGAIVIQAEDVPLPSWIGTNVDRWKDQFTKLRLLEMTQYERILFLDADGVITGPIDGIFDDPAVHEQSATLFERRGEIKEDEGAMPAQYVFAARSDNAFTGRRDHPFPPDTWKDLSAGFWVAAPSVELYNHLMAVMAIPDRFDSWAMEQSLMNYVFRREGVMPWKELNYKWSATWPNERDLEGGVVFLHEKFWLTGPERLQKLWWDAKERMELFFDGVKKEQ
jgi:alpha-N-acetylglucosamine transferase